MPGNRARSRSLVAVTLIAIMLPGVRWHTAIRASPEQDAPDARTGLRDRMRDLDRDARAKAADALVREYAIIADEARTLGVAEIESRALAALGRVAVRLKRFDEAAQHFERALALATSADDAKAIVNVLVSMGQAAAAGGRPIDAERDFRRAIAVSESAGDIRESAWALDNLARLEQVPGPEAIAAQERAVDLARRAGDRALEANALHGVGDRYFAAGDMASAFDRYEAAALLLEQIEDADEDLAGLYTSMGRLQRRLGFPERAIPLYARSLALQRAAHDTVGMVQSLNATAVAHAASGDDRRALDYYEQALALAKTTDVAQVVDFATANLAGGLLGVEAYARAAPMLEGVLQRGNDAYPGIRHRQLAGAYLRLQRLPEARAHADRAIEISKDQPTQLPIALVLRAEILTHQGDVAGAMADLDAAVGVIEQMRARLVALDYMKQGFATAFQQVYSAQVSLAVTQRQDVVAIETMERGRARAFRDLLASRDLLGGDVNASRVAPAGIVPAVVPGSTSSPGTSLTPWRTPGRATSSQAVVAPGSIDDLRAVARRLDSTLVNYWVDDESLFIGVVDPAGQVRVQRVEISSRRLSTLVAEAMSASRIASGTRDPWRELYTALLAPIRDALPARGHRITIVPHRVLGRLPFAALRDARGRYLVEDFTIHYAPTASMLGTSAPLENASGRTFLFVADPILPTAKRRELALAPLAGARAEVAAIQRLVPAGASRILMGADATEEAVRAAMPGRTVVHFATHGIARDAEPLDSYLALGATGSSDGHLAASELYDMRLPGAELVVLGACRSGGGVVTGDGIAELARALFSAGARSIVASVWDVPDQPASHLLPAFYRAWVAGAPRAESLRRAQLGLIADLRAGRVRAQTAAGEVIVPEHPAVWAGFVLLGEP